MPLGAERNERDSLSNEHLERFTCPPAIRLDQIESQKDYPVDDTSPSTCPNDRRPRPNLSSRLPFRYPQSLTLPKEETYLHSYRLQLHQSPLLVSCHLIIMLLFNYKCSRALSISG